MTEGNEDLHAEVRRLREQNAKLKTALCRLVFFSESQRRWISQWHEDANLGIILGDCIKPSDVLWDGKTR